MRKSIEDTYTERLHEEASKYKYYCKCSHSVVIYPFEHRDNKECDWCHRLVFNDAEKQKKYDEKLKREEFKLKMYKLMR